MFSFIRRERFASEMKWKSFNNSPGASRIKLCKRTAQKENVIMQLGKKWVGTEPRDDTHPPRLKFHRSRLIFILQLAPFKSFYLVTRRSTHTFCALTCANCCRKLLNYHSTGSLVKNIHFPLHVKALSHFVEQCSKKFLLLATVKFHNQELDFLVSIKWPKNLLK